MKETCVLSYKVLQIKNKYNERTFGWPSRTHSRTFSLTLQKNERFAVVKRLTQASSLGKRGDFDAPAKTLLKQTYCKYNKDQERSPQARKKQKNQHIQLQGGVIGLNFHVLFPRHDGQVRERFLSISWTLGAPENVVAYSASPPRHRGCDGTAGPGPKASEQRAANGYDMWWNMPSDFGGGTSSKHVGHVLIIRSI